jgi:hypothetical protein
MNNSDARKLRQAFRLLYSVVTDDRGQEELDRMRMALESKHRIELYLEDLHEELDPPDNEDEIPPFDEELAKWLSQIDQTMIDYYDDSRLQRRAEVALGCKFTDRGRRIP